MKRYGGPGWLKKACSNRNCVEVRVTNILHYYSSILKENHHEMTSFCETIVKNGEKGGLFFIVIIHLLFKQMTLFQDLKTTHSLTF